MMQRRSRARAAGLAALFLTVGCQDVVLNNPNHREFEQGLQVPNEVLDLIGTSYFQLLSAIHSIDDVNYLLPALGNETTSQIVLGGAFEHSRLPRQAMRNEATWMGPQDPKGVDELWRRLNEVVSNNNEGLWAIQNGIQIFSGTTTANRVDDTPRTEAWGWFVRGLALGHLAMLFDQAPVTAPGDITDYRAANLNQLVLSKMKPYPEVLAAAIESLDRSIAVINRIAPPGCGPTAQVGPCGNFTIPAYHSRAAGPTADILRRLANTFAAQFMVYSARTPQERQQVNWTEVLRRTNTTGTAGVTNLSITANFTAALAATELGLTSGYLQSIQRNTPGCATCQRIHYDVVGPADVSGAWQAYLATPIEERTRFDIVSPDRRIVGPGGPQSNGSYVRWLANDHGFVQSRGTNSFSAYQWYRQGGTARAGTVPVMSLDERNLLRAEALIRTNAAASALALVNGPRTRARVINGVSFAGLPAVTATGVPASTQTNPCVPRTRAGACGALLDALIYERRVELIGVNAIRSYVDNRGFGLLPEGTPLHLPVPARELQALGRAPYTYGGVGGNCAAGSQSCSVRLVN
jgi:hypothetical protein